MRVVAGHFNSLDVPYAFLGAAVLPLLVDDPELSEIRPTKDVDLTVKVVTLGELYQLEEKLRAAGFRNDTKEGAPICRWVVSGVTVDVMPTEGSVCVHAMRRSRGGRGRRRSCRVRGPRSVRRGLR